MGPGGAEHNPSEAGEPPPRAGEPTASFHTLCGCVICILRSALLREAAAVGSTRTARGAQNLV